MSHKHQATSKALKEADNWTTLTTEIEDVFDGSSGTSESGHVRSGDIDLLLATTKLNGIQASLKILTHVPDYEDRVLHVEGLKNRLEALASPKLVAAFNGVDTESAKFFVKMFADMERLPQLLKYYRKCIRARLLKAWSESTNNYKIDGGNFGHQATNQESLNDPADVNIPTLLECIQKFFSVVIACTKEQLSWFEVVFGNECSFTSTQNSSTSAHDNLIEILLEVYSSLEPRLEECISNASDHILAQGSNRNDEQGKRENYIKEKALLNFLIQVKKEVNSHVQDIDALVLPPNNENTGFSGRINARLRDFARLIYQCFKIFVAKYPDIEKSVLTAELKFTGIQTSKDIVDELRNVSGSVPKLTECLRLAARRCFDLTEGCMYPCMILSVFPHIIELYSERYRTLMKRLDKRKSASHSWIILGQSLSLNQACGELLLRLEEFDVALTLEFFNHTKPFLGSVNNSGQAMIEQSEKGIYQHDLFLLENQSPNSMITANKLREFYKALNPSHDNTTTSKEINESNNKQLRSIVTNLCEELQATTFSILFHPLTIELITIYNPEMTPNMVETIWKNPWAGSDSRQTDMPDFSFAPQEYITKIGQYLMTLPQHLEPYMTHDNLGLTRALQERVFPYCSGVATVTAVPNDVSNADRIIDLPQYTPADFLLSCIARATCHNYQEAILKIPELSPNAAKQLYTDIGNSYIFRIGGRFDLGGDSNITSRLRLVEL